MLSGTARCSLPRDPVCQYGLTTRSRAAMSRLPARRARDYRRLLAVEPGRGPSHLLRAARWRLGERVSFSRVTTGRAPPTLAEMARQRLRWATDSLRLFFWDNPLLKHGLTFRQRLHYRQTTGVYYLAGPVVFLLCPVLYLFGGVSRCGSTASASYCRASAVLPGAVRDAGRLPPAGRCAASGSEQLVLAPVFLLAVLRGAIVRPVRGGVTRKSKQASVSRMVLFMIGLLGMSLAALAVAARSRRTGAVLAAAWAAWCCFELGVPVTAVIRWCAFCGRSGWRCTC